MKYIHPPTHCKTVRNSVSARPKAFSGSSSRVSRLPPEQYSITSTFCLEGSYRMTETFKDVIHKPSTLHIPELLIYFDFVKK